MSQIEERIRRLLALAQSEENGEPTHEARNAAVQACRLMRAHGFVPRAGGAPDPSPPSPMPANEPSGGRFSWEAVGQWAKLLGGVVLETMSRDDQKRAARLAVELFEAPQKAASRAVRHATDRKGNARALERVSRAFGDLELRCLEIAADMAESVGDAELARRIDEALTARTHSRAVRLLMRDAEDAEQSRPRPRSERRR